eukprot:m.57256 g.57256  ORF g.57256 m.57256 type:complete len:90 (+) comp9343_c0_seq3:64-333(+)
MLEASCGSVDHGSVVQGITRVAAPGGTVLLNPSDPVLFPPHGSWTLVRSTQQHSYPRLPSLPACPFVPGGCHGQLYCFVQSQPVEEQYA